MTAPPAPVTLLVNTSHALANARGAVSDAGLKPETDVAVIATSPFQRPYVPPDRVIEEARRLGATVVSSSFSNWSFWFDSALYRDMVGNGIVHVFAYEPRQPQPRNAPPPAAFVTVNAVGKMTGDGIEFGVAPRYLNGRGGGTTPSEVTAQLAGLMASLKYRHPAWNWFDVKAALRATSANFGTGYDPAHYGYGAIDYAGANALGDPTTLPLFPPAAISLLLWGDEIDFRINSFRQSRRVADLLLTFTVPPRPSPHELTLPELVARGGRLVFSGDRSTTTNRVSYQALRDETIWFVWLTQDAAGRCSRIEPYAIIGPVTLQAAPHLVGPRRNPAPAFVVR